LEKYNERKKLIIASEKKPTFIGIMENMKLKKKIMMNVVLSKIALS
jgi:hypothetical protein